MVSPRKRKEKSMEEIVDGLPGIAKRETTVYSPELKLATGQSDTRVQFARSKGALCGTFDGPSAGVFLFFVNP